MDILYVLVHCCMSRGLPGRFFRVAVHARISRKPHPRAGTGPGTSGSAGHHRDAPGAAPGTAGWPGDRRVTRPTRTRPRANQPDPPAAERDAATLTPVIALMLAALGLAALLGLPLAIRDAPAWGLLLLPLALTTPPSGPQSTRRSTAGSPAGVPTASWAGPWRSFTAPHSTCCGSVT